MELIRGFKREIKSGWREAKSSLDITSGKVRQMRGWQQECFEQIACSKKKNTIINAPTGSGKTLEMCYLSSDFIANKIKHKAIICVPQTIIAGGFQKEYELVFPDGTSREWHIENDLCEDLSTEKSKSNRLIEFLSEYNSDRATDRIILCTHQTLGRVFQRLQEENKLSLFQNLYLWMDEAHHSMNTENGSNNMGEIVNHFLSHPEKGLIVNLATATLFRGDRQAIIQNGMVDSFLRYNLSYDKYFEGLDYLKSFSFDFLLHKNGWFEPIKELFKDKTGKTIVFIPTPNSRHSTGDKYQEVWEVIWAIAGRRNAKYTEDENGVVTIHKNGKDIVIVDLVDEDKQEAGKRFVLDHPGKVDVIINIKIFAEGADWPEANREIIVGTKNSLNQLMQMIGRLFRDDKSKAGIPVEIIQVVPHVSPKINKDKFKEQLNDYMKAIYASLILEMIINPITLSIPLSKEPIEREVKVNEIMEYLMETVGDSEYINLIEEIGNSFIEFRDAHPEIKTKELEEEYGKIVSESLKESGVELFNVELTEMIIGSFKRRTTEVNKSLKQVLKGIDVSNIDFDIIKESDPIIGFFLAYTNVGCGIKDLKELRNVIDALHERWMENFNKVKEFVETNGEYPSRLSVGKEENLSIWIKTQKETKKEGKLTEERIKLLENLLNWEWDVLSANWNETFNTVKSFIQKNNKYPSEHSINKEEEKILVSWISTQRQSKRGHIKNKLTEKRIKLLESLPNWKWDVFSEKWNETFNTLKSFYFQKNRYPKQHSKNKEEKALGNWVRDQRQNKEKLTEDRFKLLDTFPKWKWDFSDNWDETFTDLKSFCLKNNKYPSYSSTDKEKSLWMWINDQRKYKKQGKLTKDQFKLLDTFPNWKWAVHSDNWDEMFNTVKYFYLKNNKYPSYNAGEEEKGFWTWIVRQRQAKNYGKITSERIKLLESLPNWKWDVFSEEWNETFNTLKSFYFQKNRYPKQHSINKDVNRLANWISNKKQAQKGKGTSKLTPERIKLLESLPNWKW